jgi:hypothetical protein
MSETIEFRNDFKQEAAKFIAEFDEAYPNWKNRVDIATATLVTQNGLDETLPVMTILEKVSKKTIDGPFLAITAAKLIVEDRLELPDTWISVPERVRSFLREAACIDIGYYEAYAVDRGEGGENVWSAQGLSVVRFKNKLEERLSPSGAEKK